MRYLNKLSVGLAVCTLLCSCSVHKTLHKESEQVDSTSVIKSEVSDVSRHDSSLTLEKSDGWTRETIIDYDVHDTDVVNRGDIEHAYISGEILHDSSNVFISSTRYKPTKITIRETGTSQTRQTGTYYNADSSGSKKSDSTRLITKTITVNKTKDKTTSAEAIIWGSLIVLCGGVAVGFWLRGKTSFLT
jgi:hypothetical protein